MLVRDVQPEGARAPDEDELEVRNYYSVLHAGIAAMKEGRSLGWSLLRELHAGLLQGVRGQDKSPGSFRETQVYLANPASPESLADARFVPPPPQRVGDCAEELGKWISTRSLDASLVRIALTHYQFETIHPFEDGNGRLGRLLIVLQMLQESVIVEPVLYVSPWLEKHREAYYTNLLTPSRPSGSSRSAVDQGRTQGGRRSWTQVHPENWLRMRIPP